MGLAREEKKGIGRSRRGDLTLPTLALPYQDRHWEFNGNGIDKDTIVISRAKAGMVGPKLVRIAFPPWGLRWRRKGGEERDDKDCYIG